MRFSPKSEKEIQQERFPVLSPGKYRFEVVDAKEDVSKKGNDMIVLKLKILDGELSTLAYLSDYLMESMAYKLRHACYSCGLGTSYESGELTAHMFIGKEGVLDLVIQKDKTGQYPDKNSVQDYSTDQQQQPKQRVQAQDVKGDDWDDLPEPPHWVK